MHGTASSGAAVTGAPQTLTVEVADVRAEARDVMTLELRAPGGGALPPFEPGAHLEITLPNGLVRHYSLINDWRETERYVVAVGRAANSRGGSDYIHRHVRAGMRLTISAPRNNFRLEMDADRYLFVAGGIGLTPIMAMIRRCEAENKSWRLIYAARSRQRAAFYEDLCGFGAERVHFHFDDECGQVLDVSDAVSRWQEGERIYCCGPAPLMQTMETLTQHLPTGTVRFEWFTAPDDGLGPEDNDSFQVQLRRSGLDLVVPPDKSILQVLEENGVDVPFSCREGLCGTCQTAVCEGEPDHRDYVLSDEEREAGSSMMVCVSRAKSPVLVLDL